MASDFFKDIKDTAVRGAKRGFYEATGIGLSRGGKDDLQDEFFDKEYHDAQKRDRQDQLKGSETTKLVRLQRETTQKLTTLSRDVSMIKFDVKKLMTQGARASSSKKDDGLNLQDLLKKGGKGVLGAALNPAVLAAIAGAIGLKLAERQGDKIVKDKLGDKGAQDFNDWRKDRRDKIFDKQRELDRQIVDAKKARDIKKMRELENERANLSRKLRNPKEELDEFRKRSKPNSLFDNTRKFQPEDKGLGDALKKKYAPNPDLPAKGANETSHQVGGISKEMNPLVPTPQNLVQRRSKSILLVGGVNVIDADGFLREGIEDNPAVKRAITLYMQWGYPNPLLTIPRRPPKAQREGDGYHPGHEQEPRRRGSSSSSFMGTSSSPTMNSMRGMPAGVLPNTFMNRGVVPTGVPSSYTPDNSSARASRIYDRNRREGEAIKRSRDGGGSPGSSSEPANKAPQSALGKTMGVAGDTYGSVKNFLGFGSEEKKAAFIKGGGMKNSPALMTRLMKDFNLTREQAAGVVGNLGHESAGLRAGMQEINPRSGRGGLGWAQWTGSRRKAFEAYLKETGQKADDPEANYGFLKRELETTHKGSLTALRRANTVEGATMSFEKTYERAGVKNYNARIAYAKRGFASYGKGTNGDGQQASMFGSVGDKVANWFKPGMGSGGSLSNKNRRAAAGGNTDREFRIGGHDTFNYARSPDGRKEMGDPGQNIVKIKLNSGKTVSVNKSIAKDAKGFLNELEGRGYKIGSLGGYANRGIAGSRSVSSHAFGAALDINPQKNPYHKWGNYSPGKTDMPEGVKHLAMKYGFAQLGNDRMHFERVSPAKRQAYKEYLEKIGYGKSTDSPFVAGAKKMYQEAQKMYGATYNKTVQEMENNRPKSIADRSLNAYLGRGQVASSTGAVDPRVQAPNQKPNLNDPSAVTDSMKRIESKIDGIDRGKNTKASETVERPSEKPDTVSTPRVETKQKIKAKSGKNVLTADDASWLVGDTDMF